MMLPCVCLHLVSLSLYNQKASLYNGSPANHMTVDLKNCHDNVSHQQKCFHVYLIDSKDYKTTEGCQAGYLIYFTRDIYALK